MEFIDILDESGFSTGESRPKKEVHEKGLWHRTVHIWIVNSKQELLLQRRSPTKDSYPNQLDISAAGHVSSGENSMDAAVRELGEELGISLSSEAFEFLLSYQNNDSRDLCSLLNKEFVDLYLVTLDFDVNSLTLQKEEVSEVMWMNYTKVEDRLGDKDYDILQHPTGDKKLFEVLRQRFPI